MTRSADSDPAGPRATDERRSRPPRLLRAGRSRASRAPCRALSAAHARSPAFAIPECPSSAPPPRRCRRQLPPPSGTSDGRLRCRASARSPHPAFELGNASVGDLGSLLKVALARRLFRFDAGLLHLLLDLADAAE